MSFFVGLILTLVGPLRLGYRKKNQGAAWEFVEIFYMIAGQYFLSRQVVDCIAVPEPYAGDVIGSSVFFDFERTAIPNNDFGFNGKVAPVGYR